MSFNKIGGVHEALGDTKKDLLYKLKTLDMLKKIYPGNHQHAIYSLNNVSISYNKLGDSKKSGEYYNKAVKMRENLSRRFLIKIAPSKGQV